jgi:hypothetical protein
VGEMLRSNIEWNKLCNNEEFSLFVGIDCESRPCIPICEKFFQEHKTYLNVERAMGAAVLTF